MKKLLLASTMLLAAPMAMAGGGGEELPVAVAPVAAPVVGTVYDCGEPAFMPDSPRLTEYFMPESRWMEKSWELQSGLLNWEWVTTVTDEPSFACQQTWEAWDRSRKESDGAGNNGGNDRGDDRAETPEPSTPDVSEGPSHGDKGGHGRGDKGGYGRGEDHAGKGGWGGKEGHGRGDKTARY